MRRVVNHIDDHAGEPLGPADLAGVPFRDLHRTFRRVHGRSPGRQLWRARLDGAHQDLRAAEPTGSHSVATIAARWGFPDPIRFATVYQAVYGRTPEETRHA